MSEENQSLEERLLQELKECQDEHELFSSSLIEETVKELKELRFVVEAYEQTAKISEIKKKHRMQLVCENDNLRIEIQSYKEREEKVVELLQHLRLFSKELSASMCQEIANWFLLYEEHKNKTLS